MTKRALFAIAALVICFQTTVSAENLTYLDLIGRLTDLERLAVEPSSFAHRA